MNTQRRIFSGIQPTGRKHLGNFLGGVRQFVSGQDRGESIYCIVNLHATTVQFSPEELRERTYDTQALLIAAGLDPSRCALYRQSDVTEHAELCWLISAVIPYGDLGRMHQFKEKTTGQRELVSAGLFFYPVLMAADILAFQADEVPVGDDQRQHVELARDSAQRFNARFGPTFKLPEIVVPPRAARVMDLQNPTKKMSTTASTDAGAIYVLDEPDAIIRKVGAATTDSGAEVRVDVDKPGISNLIEIYAAIENLTIPAVEERFCDAGYGTFKEAVAGAIIDLLTPVGERYGEIRADETMLEASLREGAAKARAIAAPNVAMTKDRMGLS